MSPPPPLTLSEILQVPPFLCLRWKPSLYSVDRCLPHLALSLGHKEGGQGREIRSQGYAINPGVRPKSHSNSGSPLSDDLPGPLLQFPREPCLPGPRTKQSRQLASSLQGGPLKPKPPLFSNCTHSAGDRTWPYGCLSVSYVLSRRPLPCILGTSMWADSRPLRRISLQTGFSC